MAINQVNGKMLQADLVRGGIDLQIESSLLYVDVTNSRIGINNLAPAVDLDVTGSMTISGTGIIGNITTSSSQITSTIANLVLSSTAGNVSVDNKRLIACADPVDATDGVNLQTLNASVAAHTLDTIISADSSVVVVDTGASGSYIEFTLDNVIAGSINSTTLTVPGVTASGSVSAADGTFGNITVGNGTGDFDITGNTGRVDINAASVTPATGLATNRLLYVDGSGFLNTSANITVSGGNLITITGTLTVTGTTNLDDLTVDANGITANTTGMDLTTTANGDLAVVTGTGRIDLQSTSALQLPSGNNSTERPGIATTTAGAFLVGYEYEIVTTGTTDFTLIGAVNSLPGTVFTATGVGTGTGTAKRTITAGLTRWNSTDSVVEWYDGTIWNSVQQAFVPTAQQFTPTASQTIFTLNKAATAESILAIINGIVQDPDSGTVYTVSGTTLTFTTGLATTDILSIRYLAY